MRSVPYTSRNVAKNTFQRIFEHNTDNTELVWHRDANNRTVKVLEGNGWKFQLDNQLPQTISPGDILHIPARTFHRIIKGQGDLKVEIVEHETEKNKS
jgi:quercetin dioxygenase-like cupin family protein